MRFLPPLLAALLATLMAFIAPPLSAQSSDAHQRLLVALTPERLNEITFEKVLQDVEASLGADADWQAVEKQCPGTLKATLAATRPTLWEYHMAEAKALREGVGAILRAKLSPEHAGQAADLYGSDLGQRLILTMAQNFSTRATVDSVNEEFRASEGKSVAIKRDAFDQDQNQMVSQTIRGLSDEERAEFARRLLGQEWFVEYSKLMPEISQARFDIANSELLPGFQQRINQEMATAARAFVAKCKG